MISLDSDLLVDLLQVYRENVSGFVDVEEFKEDVRRFFYIARQLRKYDNYGQVNVRLLLNHFQILYNVFGNKTTEVLIGYIEPELHPHLFGVMYFLYRLPIIHENKVNREMVNLIERETQYGNS